MHLFSTIAAFIRRDDNFSNIVVGLGRTQLGPSINTRMYSVQRYSELRPGDARITYRVPTDSNDSSMTYRPA